MGPREVKLVIVYFKLCTKLYTWSKFRNGPLPPPLRTMFLCMVGSAMRCSLIESGNRLGPLDSCVRVTVGPLSNVPVSPFLPTYETPSRACRQLERPMYLLLKRNQWFCVDILFIDSHVILKSFRKDHHLNHFRVSRTSCYPVGAYFSVS